jgi:hypothetical protein
MNSLFSSFKVFVPGYKTVGEKRLLNHRRVDLARFWDPDPQSCRRQQSQRTEIMAWDRRLFLSTNANALNFFTSRCEPEGRGNLFFARDCFVASLLAMTGHLLRLH